jgi:hypothetical protein
MALSKSQIPLLLFAALLVGAAANVATYRKWNRG